MFQIGGSVVVDLPWFRFPDLAGASVRAVNLAAFLKDILEGVSEFPAESKQKHEHVATEDRQFEFPQQVP
ncbi:hypothetical protein RF55_19047 [Lasius niger]|uniref:Uncharacterized protein n=1 Tax=Lasius niger TaxID=67767 RepID=A0A0J7K042_LASNI|nr:hypothetical protein RF55_19047 [Lasius niger]